MNIALGKIIEDALPLIEDQVGDQYDKYMIEKDFRMLNPRQGTQFNDFMPKVLSSWSVPHNEILLIECIYHDMHTRCHRFDSMVEMESHILGSSSFLNWLISYVVPIVGGKVARFEIFTSTGNKVVKHVFDETSTEESVSNCKIRWSH